MERILNLLNQVQILIKKSNEILDATGERFNIFRTLGVNHYENTHSAILAEFLNPKGSHSMGDEFLKAFITIGIDNFDFDTKNAIVTTEKSTSEGRMDIVIESGNKAIIIENKIYAGDQWEQLKRYDSFAKRTYNGGHKLLYLNLWGKRASENSAGDVEYVTLSYRNHISDWLTKCSQLAYNKPMVRETITQYNNHIKRLTGMNIETKTQNELAQLLASDDNFNAAVQISGAIYEAKKIRFESIFINKLKERLDGVARITHKPDNHLERYSKIYIQPNSWNTFEICFEFFKDDAQDLFYGIYSYNKPKASDELIHLLENKFGCKADQWYYSRGTMKHHRWWGVKEYQLMQDVNSSLYTEFENVIIDLVEATKALDM